MKTTKAELLKVLRNIKRTGNDTERDHQRADDALLAFIGDKEIIDAYNAIEPKWYA